MTLKDLILKLEELELKTDNDPEVYVQIGMRQCRADGATFFPEIENICDDCIVISDTNKPNLVL